MSDMPQILTTPSVPTSNRVGGLLCDNEEDHLIVSTSYIFKNPNTSIDVCREYVVKDLLGYGTFALVFECYDVENNTRVALKCVRNREAFTQQAEIEVKLLKLIHEAVTVSIDGNDSLGDGERICGDKGGETAVVQVSKFVN